jgi:hypothetical protein
MGHVLILKKVIQATPSGSYIAGIYYPDKLKWDGVENGYPEYFKF